MTWPTRIVDIARSLDARTRRCAHSRTWATDPGAEESDGSNTVWIESIATTSGATESMWASTCGRAVSDTSQRFGGSAPSRSARNRTCWADSSAVT